jgi:hypothetical protein
MSKKTADKATDAASVSPEATPEVVAAPSESTAPAAPEVITEAAPVVEAAWPRRFEVTNNTPIDLHLTEAGVTLPANYLAPQNTAIVTFASEDALTREKTNAEAIGQIHGFVDVLIINAAD